MIILPNQIKRGLKKRCASCAGDIMNRRDLRNLRSINELWDNEPEEEFEFCYLEDMAEDIKNK